MGSCFSSNKFEGEGRTLGSAPATPAPAQPSTSGQRLGGSAPPRSTQAATSSSSSAPGTSDADREARAKAAEKRMSQLAAKGTPSQGKLSKQLEQQKST